MSDQGETIKKITNNDPRKKESMQGLMIRIAANTTSFSKSSSENSNKEKNKKQTIAPEKPE
jgi:hypothetical protein